MSEVKLGAIFGSLQSVNDELRAIEKNQKGFNYNFRGIDSCLNTIGPLFKKHGIITRRATAELIPMPDTKNKKGDKMNHFVLKATYVFTSTKDGSETFSVGFGEGLDSGDKAISCATSNAYKYVIFEMFNIATEDQMDSDMKTAKENKVEAPKKAKVEKEVKKESSFRKKKVVKEEPKEDVGEL